MRPTQLHGALLRRTRLSPTRPHARTFHATVRLRDQKAGEDSDVDPPKPFATEEEINKARSHCATLLEKYDAPSFTLGAFIPHRARDAYVAIRAFNVDVALVADNTSTPVVGRMRMQFWRDAVTKALAGTPPQEPVAMMIAHANNNVKYFTKGKRKLSKNWFHRIINTREAHLGNPPYPTLSALESYAENTYSTLFYLNLSALPQASMTTDHIASHIGKAMGIAAVLRGLPYVAFPQPQAVAPSSGLSGIQDARTQGAVLLPLDVMAEAGVKEEDVFRQGSAAPGLRDAVFTVATRANDHLITAREMISKLRSEGNVGHEFEHQIDEAREKEYRASGQQNPMDELERAFGVFMPAVATQSWLDRLEKVDFDVFHPDLRRPDWKLAWKSWWAFKQRKF